MHARDHMDPGFRAVVNVLSQVECDDLLEHLEPCRVSRGRAGARHLMAVPEIANLARDSRLLDLAQAELGSKAVAFRATLFEKSGKSELVSRLASRHCFADATTL